MEITQLAKLPRLRKSIELYRLRQILDEDSFRQVAALLSIDLSKEENPRRWIAVEEEVAEEAFEEAVERLENLETLDVVEDDEYVGRRIVERIWRWIT